MDKYSLDREYSFDDLRAIMAILRKECPWDREQTHESLKEPLLEESYELLHAINKGDVANIKEELGDVLLQVLFHTEIGREKGDFDMDEITTLLARKLIYRHPHIFANNQASDAKQVKNNWDILKMKEKGQETYSEILEDVPEALPALVRAMKIQKKAAKVGFDWENIEGVVGKVYEEFRELSEAYEKGDSTEIEEEFGDLLFSMVNLSRFFHINAEFALTNTIEKFINRFRYIEFFAKKAGRTLDELTLEEMNTLWNQAKSCTKK